MFSVVKGMSPTYICLTQIRSNWDFHLPLGSPWGQCGTLNAGKDTGSLGSTWNNNKVICICIWRELTISHPLLSCFTLPILLRDRGEGVRISALRIGETDALDRLSDLSKFPQLERGESGSRICSFDSWYNDLSSTHQGIRGLKTGSTVYKK